MPTIIFRPFAHTGIATADADAAFITSMQNSIEGSGSLRSRDVTSTSGRGWYSEMLFTGTDYPGLTWNFKTGVYISMPPLADHGDVIMNLALTQCTITLDVTLVGRKYVINSGTIAYTYGSYEQRQPGNTSDAGTDAGGWELRFLPGHGSSEIAFWNLHSTPGLHTQTVVFGAFRFKINGPPPPPLPFAGRIRYGSIRVRDTKGTAPTTASFTVRELRPRVGQAVRVGVEPETLRVGVEIGGGSATPGQLDEDEEPLIFDGVIQTVDESYEATRENLSWPCTAIDHIYDLNKRHPFGVFEDVAAHTVIETIMGTYAPAFDVSFVQQIAVPITITFDGTQETSAALDAIKEQLEGCSWYLDGFALHFYHSEVTDAELVLAGRPPAPPPLTPPTVSPTIAKDAEPITNVWFQGPCTFCLTFVYENGLESQASDEILVESIDMAMAMAFASLPLGPAFFGVPCVRRYLYQKVFHRAGGGGLPYEATNGEYSYTRTFVWTIPDNVSTTYNLTGAAPRVRRRPPTNTGDAPAPTTAPTVASSPLNADYAAIVGSSESDDWRSRWYVTFGYANGKESAVSPASDVLSVAHDDLFVYHLSDIPIGAPNDDGSPVLWRGIYAGGPTAGYVVSDAVSLNAWRVVPNNTDTEADAIIGATLGESYLTGGPPDPYVSHPFPHQEIAIFDMDNRKPTSTTSADFGPYLEGDITQPDALVDDSPTLIFDNPALTFDYDISQLRNRVYVRGASRELTADAAIGATTLALDASIFPAGGGGQVYVEGRVLDFVSVGIDALTLAVPLAFDLLAGADVFLWAQVDDVAAQGEQGEREAVNGVPTDGVREFTITDASLDSLARCLARGYAELVLFARPILTVRYATFDRKTRAGRLVAIALADPPLVHPGLLIQDVSVDMFQVSTGAPWAPRFTVTASSVRFTLGDLIQRVQLD